MPKARKYQVSLDVTPYYHCVSRCVRRAFLCGVDIITRKSYEHRRQWVEDRILFLTQVFAIDVCAFAIMSNHYHVLLHVNQAKSGDWSDREVCQRWHKLFHGTELTQLYIEKKSLSRAEMKAVDATILEWRQRLSNVSWFMRLINEPIARQANLEDECTGKFWEARFKSQALCDEKALAACMTYIDLNPIRAKEADTLESSDYTSIKLRTEALRCEKMQPHSLAKFVGNLREPMPDGLPFSLEDYLELVDWTGRVIRDDKIGAIAADTPSILDRLDINQKQWIYFSTRFESRFKSFVGSVQSLRKALDKLGYKRTPGFSQCKSAFG